MPRTKVFNEDQALEAAMLLFWQHGYEATSMQALEQAMGLKRTSIYNAFGNKRSLFQQVLQRYLSVVLSRYLMTLQQTASAIEAIENVLLETIKLHFNKNHPGGCMVVLSLLESQQHDKQTKAILDAALRQLNDAITQRVKQGIKDGELNEHLKCTAVADQVTALITGMLVMAKANFGEKKLRALIAPFLLSLQA